MNYFLKSQHFLLAQPHVLCGVSGKLVRTPGINGLWELQQFTAEREFKGQGGVFSICITYERGHASNTSNTFAMTRHFDGCTGPLETKDAEKFWPELAHLVQWHLSSDGVPMYYIENTLYHAEQKNFALARGACLWPDAPEALLDGESCYLEVALRERLTALQQQFRDDLAATGLILHP